VGDNLPWLIGLGVGAFLVTLAVTGFVLVRIPADYFARERRIRRPEGGWSVGAILGLAAKNLLGVILVVLGVALSVPGVPGQGLLTILIGLFLVDFPGKFKLQRRIVRQRAVRTVINRLRRRFGRPELDPP
jgi:hypothetical protein